MIIPSSNLIFNHILKPNFQTFSLLVSSFSLKDLSEQQKLENAKLMRMIFVLCKQELMAAPSSSPTPQKINNYLSPFFDTFASQCRISLTHLLDSLILTNSPSINDEQPKGVIFYFLFFYFLFFIFYFLFLFLFLCYFLFFLNLFLFYFMLFFLIC